MKIAIIAESFNAAAALLPVMGEIHPSLYEVPPITVVPRLWGARTRGVKWVEFPVSGDLDIGSVVLTSYWPCQTMMHPDDINWPPLSDEPKPTEDETASRIRDADIIYVADDEGILGIHLMHLALQRVFPEGYKERRIVYTRLRECETFPCVGDKRENARRILANAPSAQEVMDEYLDYSRTMNRFLTLYQFNSQRIFWRVTLDISLPIFWPNHSRLQFLYALRRRGTVDFEEVCRWAREWKGTGKYQTGTTDWLRMYPSSITAPYLGARLTLNGRFDYNLVAERFGPGSTKVRLTDNGERFLSALHPDCEDPDMPFRVHEWCLMPREEANQRMDRYIRTFFGKQKRFMSRRLTETAIS